MQEPAVELNAVPSYVSNMLKHLRNAWYFLFDTFKPKKRLHELMAEDFDKLLKEMRREHALEAEMDAAMIAAMEEEHILTTGRPVTLLPPSRTLH